MLLLACIFMHTAASMTIIAVCLYVKCEMVAFFKCWSLVCALYEWTIVHFHVECSQITIRNYYNVLYRVKLCHWASECVYGNVWLCVVRSSRCTAWYNPIILILGLSHWFQEQCKYSAWCGEMICIYNDSICSNDLIITCDFDNVNTVNILGTPSYQPKRKPC